MKQVIYYFTGTGNSLFAARALASELKECELIPITDAVRTKRIEKAEVMGICIPNYGYRAPRLVEEFLKMLDREEGNTYIFTVTTTAGHMGNHIRKIGKLLKHSSYQGGYTLFMPFNYLAFGHAGSEEDQRKRTEKAAQEIRQIAEKVRKRESHFDPVVKYFKTYVNPGILYSLSYRMIPKLDGQYWLNDECKGCGTCSKVCPVGNISMEDKQPHWQHKCEQCWACLHWCPSEAIQYGKATESKNRYHHPSVTIEDMKLQAGSR